MGFRIHKCLGYGITDFKGRKDPRFAPAFFDEDEMERDLKIKDMAAWALNHIDEIYAAAEIDLRNGGSTKKEDAIRLSTTFFYVKRDEEEQIRRSIIYEEEFGKKNVVVFQPCNSMKKWSHYDDDIDYHESGKEPRNKVNVLKNSWAGIYPYLGQMRRFRGVPLPDFDDQQYQEGRMEAQRFSFFTGRWDKGLDAEARENVRKDLVENWRCQIPVEITIAMLYLGIATNAKELINDLRPMIYTYWS